MRPLTDEERDLVRDNLRLVYKLANTARGWLPYDDGVQEGTLGLMRSVQYYDPQRGPFGPHAGRGILRAIFRARDEDTGALRVPHVSQDFRRQRGRLPRPAEWSLDDPALHQELAAPLPDPPDSRLPALRRVLSTLRGRDARIIHLRYVNERSRTEVAERLGLSRERVRQLEVAALARLRRRIEILEAA